MSDDIISVATALAGTKVDSADIVGGGGNSRIYKIIAGGKTFALKRYPSIENDKRDRFQAEKQALQFFEQNNIKNVPRWLKGEPPFALLEWMEGVPVSTSDEADIDAAVSFLSVLQNLTSDAMPLASEACLSAAAIVQQVESRLEKLRDIEGVAEFLEQEFSPAMRERVAAAKDTYSKQSWDFNRELPQAERALIPADFGFHNALKNKQGLVFLDFEYFGYDDPVKLIADFLLHPAMALAPSLKARFFAKMMEIHRAQPSVSARFSALYPLFGLRWTLILLNEFLPERWQARAQASGESDWEDAKRRQLKKARAMLAASKD